MISPTELSRRWSRLRDRLVGADLDAVIVTGGPATAELIHISGYQYRGGNAIFLLARNGDVRLILRGPFGLSLPRPTESWVSGTSSEIVYEPMSATPLPDSAIDWLKAHDATRVAVNVPTIAALTQALTEALPHVSVVSWQAELLQSRFVKGEEELDIIRRSVAIADEIFARAAEFVQVGRPVAKVVTDVHRFALDHGADPARDAYQGSLNLIFRHKPGGVNGYAEDTRPLEKGDTFTLEISPRVHGYFSQLTVPVSIGPAGPEMRRLFDVTARAREAGLAEVRPGSNSARAAQAMLDVIAEEGFEPVNTDIGHLLGIELTEPRLGLNNVIEFEAGMTLVFHPSIRSDAASLFMRGDTYVVTDSEPQRLNSSPVEFLEV
ncbi:M24 family metallopeptidase [Streptomyces sp. NPDC096311]|uniref:M24 family metallopeptidase n=1 Tax=Streptomyces sp. NPDC096311 TaxID=3366083 RepID=UPI0037FD46B0